MKRLLFILLFAAPLLVNAQTKQSIVTLKNGTELKGVIKSIDATDALTIELAGIETSIKMADVAKVEDEKVFNHDKFNLQSGDTDEDVNSDKTNQSFIGVSGGERFCFKILSKRDKTVEIIFNENIKYKGSHCVVPASIEYDNDTYTIVSIGKEAFYKNNNIEMVEIPSTVKSIGQEAFEYCTHLRGVVFSQGLERIESEAFKACPIEKIDLPNTVKYLGRHSFFTANANTMFKSKIKWVSIPESVKEIGEQSFSRCVNLFGKSFASSCHIELLPSWINEEEAERIGLSEDSYKDYKNRNN